MKYWNKDKRIRQHHWHRVERGNVLGYNETKRILQLHESPGRFYLYYGSRTIWFEREQDATWFLLRWA
jgi:hypothetical protein